MNNSMHPTTTLPSAGGDTREQEWKGLTIDELKMRRAKALVLREVNRASVTHQFANMRENVSNNGVRGLIFKQSTVAGLKKADYAFIGAKAIALLVRLYLRRKR